jgi:hypothetical protein
MCYSLSSVLPLYTCNAPSTSHPLVRRHSNLAYSCHTKPSLPPPQMSCRCGKNAGTAYWVYGCGPDGGGHGSWLHCQGNHFSCQDQCYRPGSSTQGSVQEHGSLVVWHRDRGQGGRQRGRVAKIVLIWTRWWTRLSISLSSPSSLIPVPGTSHFTANRASATFILAQN